MVNGLFSILTNHIQFNIISLLMLHIFIIQKGAGLIFIKVEFSLLDSWLLFIKFAVRSTIEWYSKNCTVFCIKQK